jgi:adenosylcobinamide-GDP ribazoletransferase
LNPLRPIAAAFAFLTRLPLGSQTVGAGAGELGRSITWFPLVGAALGTILIGTERLLRGHLSAGLAAVGLVALLAMLTGGLHLDGLADLFDALGGGRGDRARMLEIMKDSRIGAHGAAALFLVLAGKALAAGEAIQRGESWRLFAAPVLARWAVIPLLIFFRYARADGLGKPFHRDGRLAHLLGATALCAALVGWLGRPVLLPAGAALAAALAVGMWIDRRLGGLTGDVYGAAIELSELAFLVTSGLGRS